MNFEIVDTLGWIDAQIVFEEENKTVWFKSQKFRSRSDLLIPHVAELADKHLFL
jgi:hypothetical protein